MINTLEGYAIPLNINNALPRMKIRPYTDEEWKRLSPVIITSDSTWYPSMLGCDIYDKDEWFETIYDNVDYKSQKLFDIV